MPNSVLRSRPVLSAHQQGTTTKHGRWARIAGLLVAGSVAGCGAAGHGGFALPGQAIPAPPLPVALQPTPEAPIVAATPPAAAPVAVSEPTAEPTTDADVQADEPKLYSAKGLVRIYVKPDRDAGVIGAFRAGQGVRMRDTTLTDERKQRRLFRCTEGWYPVEPRGYVCVGGPGHAITDGNDPRVLAARAVLPDVESDYPFKYGISIGAPQYLRIPTEQEQRKTEKNLDKHLAKLPAADPKKGGAVDKTPAGRPPSASFLKYIAATKPALTHDDDAFKTKKVSWTQEFDANGRTWLLTPDMTLLPKDKVRTKPLPTLKGIDLKKNPEITLPVAFFWLDDAHKYRRGDDGKLYETDEIFKRHSFTQATMKQSVGPGGIYWQMRDGDWVKYQKITMIRKAKYRPRGVSSSDKWVDVRVTWGFLIAYEGDTPVYLTAISPGVDGINPRKHATARGRHVVGWKLLSGDMSGRENGKDWFVDEVPWVQYYKDNYAVHGAWWHNDFGRPKSHGCINVAPADARRLFKWMDPVIPEGWYAANSYYPHVKGTLVNIRF